MKIQIILIVLIIILAFNGCNTNNETTSSQNLPSSSLQQKNEPNNIKVDGDLKLMSQIDSKVILISEKIINQEWIDRDDGLAEENWQFHKSQLLFSCLDLSTGSIKNEKVQDEQGVSVICVNVINDKIHIMKHDHINKRYWYEIYDKNFTLTKTVNIPYEVDNYIKPIVALSYDLSRLVYVKQNKIHVLNLENNSTIIIQDFSNSKDIVRVNELHLVDDTIIFKGFAYSKEGNSNNLECYGKIKLDGSELEYTERSNIKMSRFNHDKIIISDTLLPKDEISHGTALVYLDGVFKNINFETKIESQYVLFANDNSLFIFLPDAIDEDSNGQFHIKEYNSKGIVKQELFNSSSKVSQITAAEYVEKENKLLLYYNLGLNNNVVTILDWEK